MGVQPPSSLQSGGVSSTVKLSVSKTELLGSNPSSPASFIPQSGAKRQARGTQENTTQ